MRKKLLIDNRYIGIAEEKWGSEFDIIPSPVLKSLPEPVSCHPDMSLCCLGDIFIAETTVYSYYKKYLKGCNVLCGKQEITGNYPWDIAYNVLVSEDMAIANFKYTDSVVKQELEKLNYKMIDVKQGYARCSSAVLGKSIISADPSIINACKKMQINFLEIEKGYVELSGYEYGFIGGATGFVDGKLLFFGDITKHPDFNKIMQFTKNNSIEIDYIKDFPLTDVGTIIGIDTK